VLRGIDPAATGGNASHQGGILAARFGGLKLGPGWN